eukprot:5248057-Pyramimonas_sp.AAC.1
MGETKGGTHSPRAPLAPLKACNRMVMGETNGVNIEQSTPIPKYLRSNPLKPGVGKNRGDHCATSGVRSPQKSKRISTRPARSRA